MNGHAAQICSCEDMPNPNRLRTARRIAAFAGSCLAAILFLSSCAVTPTGSNPAALPISPTTTCRSTNRSLTESERGSSTRLGEGQNMRDRYFMVPFAFENRGHDPESTHSFITVVRVLADDKQPKLTPGMVKRTYKDRNFEAFTISWLPDDFLTTHMICVFKGFGSYLVPSRNKCPVSVGRTYNLEESISMAVYARNVLCMWLV